MNRLVFLATHWVNQKSSIYTDKAFSGTGLESMGEFIDGIKYGVSNLLDNGTDFLGDALRFVVTAFGLVLEAVLGMEEISLTRIMYGRLLSGVDVNKFAFELAPGNTFGIVGAMSYSVLRATVISFMVLVAAFLLCKGIWLGNGEKAMVQFRSSLGNYFISASLLFLMPHIFEVMTYIKDLILYALGKASGITETGSYLKGYRQMATSVSGIFDTGPSVLDEEFWTEYSYMVEGSFFAGCMYLGMVCMTVYFAYTYITNAMSQMIAFTVFPLVALVSVKDTKVLGRWFSSVVALMAVPIVDCVLFMIPLQFAGVMDESHSYKGSFVLFLVCMAILPARKVVRRWIGGETFFSASGMAAILMMGRLATQAAGAAKNYSSSMSDAGADRQRAKMYRELAGDPNVRITDGGMAAMSMSGGTGANAKVSEFTSEHAKKMAGLANVDNFEDKEFANVLSDDQRAHFYDQRAKRAEAKARGAVIGGALGGLGGFGATMFGGPVVQMAGMSLGASLGGTVGAKIPKKGNMPYVQPMWEAPVAQGQSADSGVKYPPAEHVERASGDVVSKEEFANAFSGDNDQYYEFRAKQNLRAIGSGPIKVEDNRPVSKAALPGAAGETISKLGTDQYKAAVRSALSDPSIQEALKKMDAGDMSGIDKVGDKVAKVYGEKCNDAKFEGKTLEAMKDGIYSTLKSAYGGFSGDSKEFEAFITDGGAVASRAGVSFEDLGEGLGGMEGFNKRFETLTDRITDCRMEKQVSVVEFSVSAGNHPMWNSENLEAQNEAIRQTAAGYVNQYAMGVVEAVSPNSLRVDKEADAARLTKEFCYGFTGDDLCKILGIDADIVRAYRP